MSEIHFDKFLDTSGLNCPLPVIKARKEVRGLGPGQILKVVCTDRGSVKDFQGWSKVDKKIDLLGQDTESSDGTETFVHYLQLLN